MLSVLPFLWLTWFTNVARPTLTINVQNLRGQTGRVYVALHQSGDGFIGSKPKEMRKIPVTGTQLQVSFSVEPGDYAVAVFQDTNDNGKLDTRLFGIPKEPYGFSNNFRPRLSAPKFSDCRITIKESLKIDIRLID